MASKTIIVRDAIAAAILAALPTDTPNPPATLPMAATLLKKWVAILEPSVDVPEDGPPLITVMGKAQANALESRTTRDDEVQSSVVVQRKVRVNERGEPPDDVAAADLANLLGLAEAIVELLDSGANFDIGGTGWKLRRIEHAPLWIQEHLWQNSLFTSVITVVHHKSRDR